MPKTILVMDDEEQIRTMLKKMLENSDFTVLEAPNGKVGLKLYRENQVDLVITDIIMPEKEGIETIRELKRDYPDVKMIAISGGGSIGPDEYLILAKNLGVMRTLVKPFSMDELLAAVNELI